MDGRDTTENAIFERFNSASNILSIVNVISKGLYGSSSLASEMSYTEGQLEFIFNNFLLQF